MDSTSSKDTLVYDQLNRLLSINGGAKGSYYYDGEGKRLRKDYAGSKTIYLYDQWGNLMTEVDTTGNLMCEYIWANGKLVVKIYQDDFYPESFGKAGIESGEPGPPPVFQEYIFYYHLDHLGTPLALTNEVRNICWSADYLPFGEIYSELIAPISNEIRFPGQYHDRETGMYYNWHRYYKPSLGRYYQADPIGQLSSMDLYSYVANNPKKWVDPNGLEIFWPGSYGFPIFNPSCANRVAKETYQQSLSSGLEGLQTDDTPWNAYLHCLWSCEMIVQCGWFTAFISGVGHELWHGGIPYIYDRSSSKMDLHNNAEGRACAGKKYGNTQNCKYTDCNRCCRDKLISQELNVLQR